MMDSIDIQQVVETYVTESKGIEPEGIHGARATRRAVLEGLKETILSERKRGFTLDQIEDRIYRHTNGRVGSRSVRAAIAEWEGRPHKPRIRKRRLPSKPTRPRKSAHAATLIPKEAIVVPVPTKADIEPVPEQSITPAPETPTVAPTMPATKPKRKKGPTAQGPVPQGLFSFDEP